MAADYPISGGGTADMNTMLFLFRESEKAEAELKQPDPQIEDSEVDQVVTEYLESHKCQN